MIARDNPICYTEEPRAHVVDHRTPKSDDELLVDNNRRPETKVLKVPDIKFAIFALDDRNLLNQIGFISDLISTWSVVSTGSRLDVKAPDMSWSTF